QQRLPKAVWRGIHFLSFLTFFVGLAHGLGSGTDRSQQWALALYAITAALVVGLCVHRILWEPKAVARPAKPATARRMEAAQPIAGGKR
ncbi:MAG: hypothetical protein M3Z19_11675, partial [Chloroflexota bacterium]|nr:hypothetical protein [Chloroflexota bacterium]